MDKINSNSGATINGGIISFRVLHLVVLVVCTLLLIPAIGWAKSPATTAERGKSLFEQHCSICHGDKGKGDGPGARFLFPKPRDLTSGLFKVRSTPTGDPPTDNDILITLKNGLPGTAMPSFIELQKKDLNDLVRYVKKIGEVTEKPTTIIRTGTPPPVTKKLIAKGKEIYKQVKCWECHGEEGKGDGPKADKLEDDWKQPAPPNAFVRGVYKGGGTPSDIYLRFTTGMSGSPMPSYEDSLTNEERWAVVYYNLSLAGPFVAKQPTTGKIMAKKVSGEVPGDPEDALWKKASAFKIPLMLLWQRPDAPWRDINVKALHNGKEIAFHMEWKDETMNTTIGVNTFRDGAALQFPASSQMGHGDAGHKHVSGMTPPLFLMGHGEGKEVAGAVNIWHWKADWQEAIDHGVKPDMPMKALLDRETERNTMEKAAAGWEVAMAGGGTGTFGSRLLVKSPVENLIAGGFGTLTMRGAKSQNISGKGQWKDGVWSVVFKRALEGADDDVKFDIGKLTPIAFATWDGGQSEVDGMKALSTWYYVSLGK